jgi:hypothetical protein
MRAHDWIHARPQTSLPRFSPAVDALLAHGVLDRLPVTFSGYWFEQIREWNLLFPAEKDLYERLLTLLDRTAPQDLEQAFAPLREIEKRMGVTERSWPRRQFTLDQIDFLNRSPYNSQWRQAIAEIFSRIQSALDKEVAQKSERRLAIIVAPSELPVGPERMWTRLHDHGRAIPVQAPENPDDYLALLLTGARRSARKSSLVTACTAAWSDIPYSSWIVEADGNLSSFAQGDPNVVQYSYTGLAAYRRRLMREVDEIVRDRRVRGPRELSARLKQLNVTPSESALARDPVLAEFARATLLSGNGTLLINNTFVEWASMQAVRRARPRLLLTGFGIRNKVKPFSSLLIYADQDNVTPIPSQMDMLGSYVDLEVLYQYIWQEFEKYPEYRGKTAYWFVAEGMDQVFTIAPATSVVPGSQISLDRLHQAMGDWLSLT